MTTAQAITTAPVRKSVTVACSPDRAFDVFARQMGRWWLPTHSIAPSGLAQVVIEPMAGGRWYEVGREGEICDWGQVALWQPPGRLVLIWRLTPDFTHDPALHTEVEVTFTPAGAGTRVDLEHRGLDAYGAAGGAMRGIFDSQRGWSGLLAAYADRAPA